MGVLDTIVDVGKTLIKGVTGGQQSASTTSTTEPWKPQQPYLLAGFDDAANLYADKRNDPYFNGDTYANMNPQQAAALNGIYGYAPQGAANAGALTGSGMALTGSGTAGLQQAGWNLADFRPEDPTQGNINNAGMYANNPALDGAIDAASRDVTRNLSEVQLPGIARGADANGNLNSSRTGIAEGIAMRGAADRIGDIGSSMRYDAYNNGLNLSEQARSTNQGDYLNAQYQSGGLADRSVTQGFGGIGSGQGVAYDNFDAQSAAGGAAQLDEQGQLDANFARWQGQDQREWDQLGMYNNAIAGNYGSTTAGTTSAAQPGYLQTALGLASTGLGLYGAYKNLNQQVTAPKTGLYG